MNIALSCHAMVLLKVKQYHVKYSHINYLSCVFFSLFLISSCSSVSLLIAFFMDHFVLQFFIGMSELFWRMAEKGQNILEENCGMRKKAILRRFLKLIFWKRIVGLREIEGHSEMDFKTYFLEENCKIRRDRRPF